MPSAWNKGFTKETHPSVRKISVTMRRKRIDNFHAWRESMRNTGRLKFKYPEFSKDKYLSELIGVVLGDGHIEKFPRTERLVIAANAGNPGFIRHYGKIIEKVFGKIPYCRKLKNKNCVQISIYEKYISKRLQVPTGDRSLSRAGIPSWAWKNNDLLISCLKGLYEAEGSFTIHLPTGTYKAAFSNKNPKLLKDVYTALQTLNFPPLYQRYRIMISRKLEFYRLKSLISFREY